MEVQTISPSVACMKVPISEEMERLVDFLGRSFNARLLAAMLGYAHTEHSRRRAVRLEATTSTAATSTATVTSEATTTSTAAERHVVWLSGALLFVGRGSEGSVGCVPPSFCCMRGSLYATVDDVVGVVQLRYAAIEIAVVD
jgi:hypothetical protein